MKNNDTNENAQQVGGFRDSGGYFIPVLKTPNSNGVGLAELWSTLVSYKRLIILATLGGTALALAVAFLIQPIYKSEVVMVPVQNSDANSGLMSMVQGLSGLANFAGINTNRSGNKDEAIAIIRSRAFTEKFISEKNLLPQFFESEWNKEDARWTDVNDAPTIQDGVELFSRKIRTVSEDKRTGLVVLTILWKDREEASEWANELVDRVNLLVRERAIAEAEASINYLNEELEKASSIELRQAIYKLIESQINMRMLGHVQKEYSFKVIDPASVSDADHFEKPKRPVIVALGMLSSAVIGIFVALVLNALAEGRAATVRRPLDTQSS